MARIRRSTPVMRVKPRISASTRCAVVALVWMIWLARLVAVPTLLDRDKGIPGIALKSPDRFFSVKFRFVPGCFVALYQAIGAWRRSGQLGISFGLATTTCRQIPTVQSAEFLNPCRRHSPSDGCHTATSSAKGSSLPADLIKPLHSTVYMRNRPLATWNVRKKLSKY